MKFEDLNLEPEVLQGLDAMNFKEATPVQEATIPVVLDGKDLIACAQTGTGKTAAYILPLLNLLTRRPSGYCYRPYPGVGPTDRYAVRGIFLFSAHFHFCRSRRR